MLKVDEVFTEDKVSAMPYIPGQYPSAEAMRQAFDRPDELMVVGGPYGEAIIHKSQEEVVARRNVVVNEVLAEAGYTMADIPHLTFEEVFALREKIKERSK